MIWIYVLGLQDITYLTTGRSFNLFEAPFTITAMKIIMLISYAYGYLGRLSGYWLSNAL